jgi:hypothetical protein
MSMTSLDACGRGEADYPGDASNSEIAEAIKAR